MTSDKGILIKNIYYMLTYAFQELKRNNYEHIQGEDFEDIHDLFAEILCNGIAYILKHGLHREYISYWETLPTLRGKLLLQDTIKEKMNQRTRLGCEYDELSENNLFNQILKTSATLLIRHEDVKPVRKQRLKKLMIFFKNVDAVPADTIQWKQLRYDRNNRSYQMLHSLCAFLIESKLLSAEQGDKKLLQFTDDHMNMLFQHFVLEYYKRHHNALHPQARQIGWNLDAASPRNSMLPDMISDIVLTMPLRTLIIDAKYYGKTLQYHFGKPTFHSLNIYQIFTYMMNESKGANPNVDGMLLYAKTEGDIPFDKNVVTFQTGNRIFVRTLNLNQDFEGIKKELDEILT